MIPGAALIGWTGFVGGFLAAAQPWATQVRSTDLETLRGRGFPLVVCAGAPGAKWLANREPAADAAAIDRLVATLATVDADRFVLISTVDVFGDPRGVDEDADPAAVAPTPYGAHRARLEEFVLARFPGALVLRLPALYGPGLKKNVLFDLLHRHRLEHIDPASELQWYSLPRLAQDLSVGLASGLRILHLPTAPVATGRIVARCFPGVEVGPPSARPARYDLRTRHAGLFGAQGPYLADADAVLSGLAAWAEGAR